MIPAACPVCKHDAVEIRQGYLVCTNCNFYRKRLSVWRRFLVWTETERSGWWWRLGVVGWFGFVLSQHLRDNQFSLQRVANVFNALNFGIHELGHVLFQPFGEFMTILGGSLFQCMFPLLWLVAFWVKRWYFAAVMCFCWLGFSLFDVATYAADARARLLSLATFSTSYDDAHDWYQILSRLGKLQYDTQLAAGMRLAATVSALAGLTIGLAIVLRMAWLSYTIKPTDSQPSGT